jgi:hypothetical protein
LPNVGFSFLSFKLSSHRKATPMCAIRWIHTNLLAFPIILKIYYQSNKIYEIFFLFWLQTTLDNPIIVGHNHFLDPTSNLIMRINMNTHTQIYIYISPTLNSSNKLAWATLIVCQENYVGDCATFVM